MTDVVVRQGLATSEQRITVLGMPLGHGAVSALQRLVSSHGHCFPREESCKQLVTPLVQRHCVNLRILCALCGDAVPIASSVWMELPARQEQSTRALGQGPKNNIRDKMKKDERDQQTHEVKKNETLDRSKRVSFVCSFFVGPGR